MKEGDKVEFKTGQTATITKSKRDGKLWAVIDSNYKGFGDFAMWMPLKDIKKKL